MKALNVFAKSTLVSAVLALPEILNASDEQCTDPYNQGTCHAATSGFMKVTCAVNCLCPYSSSINGTCWNVWYSLSTNTTASSLNNWVLISGTTYDDTAYDYNPNDCYWTYSVYTCPPTAPGSGCLPTLSYDVAGPGARNSVVPGNACPD